MYHMNGYEHEFWEQLISAICWLVAPCPYCNPVTEYRHAHKHKRINIWRGGKELVRDDLEGESREVQRKLGEF